MKRISSRDAGRSTVFLLLALLILFLVLLPASRAVYMSPTAQLEALAMKFDGAQSCANSKCHGSADPLNEGPNKRTGNEFVLWSDKDYHNRAFETLLNDESKQIAQKLGIAKASESESCLSCHAVSVKPDLHGVDYKVSEGVSCAACHGPSEKWREPHAVEGWTEQQRKATGSHAALLKQWGLFDTKPVLARAQRCTSCHLAIDAQLVAAGHPQPIFELAYYSHADVYEGRHWTDPEGYFTAKLWAAGQVVALHEAMQQLTERAASGASDEMLKDAYDQAMGHWAVFRHALTTKALPGDAAAMNASADKLKAAMSAGQKPAVAEHARAIAQQADQLSAAVSKFEPDKAKTIAILTALASDTTPASEFGKRGQEQQSLGIYSLYLAYAGAEKPADQNDVIDTIAGLFAEEGQSMSPTDFNAALGGVKAKLPKS